MSFSAEWLALREPADVAARNADLAREVAAHLEGRGEVRVVDLGAGTGANVRALAPLIEARQTWRLIDTDAGLLAQAEETILLPGRARVETEVRDLARNPRALDFSGIDLVSASAFMDLVSPTWFDAILGAAAAAGCAVYFALSYTGAVVIDPPDALDGAIIDCVNRHQRRDKGFGAALGPRCVAHMAAACARTDLRVNVAPSDWRLGPDDGELQRRLIAGWVAAARDIAPEQSAEIEDWLARRIAQSAAGTLGITVGHSDLFARL
jgi:hypothetical protein